MKLLTPEEATVLFPLILQLKKEHKFLSPELSDEQFKADFLQDLESSALYAEIENSNLKHFAYIHLESQEEVFAWLVYSCKECWNTNSTKDFVTKIMTQLKEVGVKKIRFSTNNTKLSYERWVVKLGARLVEKTFKVTI